MQKRDKNKSFDERVERAIADNPDLPEEFVRNILMAQDDAGEALIQLLEQSQEAYAKGDHKSAKEAFLGIRRNAAGMLKDIPFDPKISDEASLQDGIDDKS